jgi:hypothetical protein
VYAVTAPEAPPRWSAFCMEETVRLVVEAVPEYAIPEVVMLVVEAFVMVAVFAVAEPSVADPIVALVEKRFVLEAVVEKKDVEVAFASVTLPVKVLVPE